MKKLIAVAVVAASLSPLCLVGCNNSSKGTTGGGVQATSSSTTQNVSTLKASAK
ncbi:MAG: hypothetical protein JO112_07365 [Planctomycetes bacterium]|nr:hypothetical protein [Planctomycetota bacterium]